MFSTASSIPRILLVDDDISQIALLHKALKSIGKLVFEQDGLAAVDHILNAPPDVILLDIEMPGLNGYEVLAKLKSEPSTSNIPVIFITAYDSVADQIKCLKSGAVDFIPKPLQPEVVAARVQTQINLHLREQELIAINQHARVTLESIGDAVITTNQKGYVTYMNPTAEFMTGIPLSQAVNREIENIMPLRIGDSGPPHINPARIALSEGRAVGLSINCQLMNQNGHWLAIENSASPLITESGDIMGSVIVFDNLNDTRAIAVKMSHRLQHDQLTNLPNRFLLMERLKDEISKCQRTGAKFGLLQLDINRFKLINEEFGFEFGDTLLKDLAQTIQNRLQLDETLSRHNADVFMVLVPDLKELSCLSNIALSIKESVMGYAHLHPEIENFSISIGLSVYPDDATDAEALMLHADAALRRAKAEPIHDGLCFYSEEMESRFTSRRIRYVQMKKAISGEGLVALYQPIVNASSGEVEAVEALMRILDNQGNFIPPIEFIPIAEETKLIIPLGEKMIHITLSQLQQWTKDGLNMRLCINISPVQFLDPNFIPFLLQAIEQYNVSPKMIELEVTESLMMESKDKVTQDLHQLRTLGISISIDDFGTGYSSLSYLKDLPVDVLKIDKSFVSLLESEVPDDILVTTINSLGRSLGLQTIAEGVETEKQAKLLLEMGVSLLQGYHISRPIPAGDIQARYAI